MNVRDWLYVYDHCSAIDAVLHKGKEGEVYNIGGNNEKPNIEITKLLLKELNKPETLIKYVEDRLGHDRRYAINCDKIKSELSWKQKYDFTHGLEKMLNWYMDNASWINNILTGEYKKWINKN